MAKLQVRPFRDRDDFSSMVDYFCSGSEAFLRGMGVDRAKLPPREEWLERLLADEALPVERRDRLWAAWILDGERVGHSSVNRILPGEEAYIHLHLWRPDLRRSGFGLQFFQLSIDHFFRALDLKRLYCEPYAENPAPNRTLQRLGFTFVRRHRAVPGAISFEQDVNLYRLDRPPDLAVPR